MPLNMEGTPGPFGACPTQPFNAVRMLKSKSLRSGRGTVYGLV
jgi:hypothetical protein